MANEIEKRNEAFLIYQDVSYHIHQIYAESEHDAE